MKRLILVSGLLMMAAAPVAAQQAGRTEKTVQAAPEKAKFASKINEFSAYTSRQSAKLAAQALNELIDMIQQSMRASAEKAAAAGTADKAGFNKIHQTQEKLYISIKAMTGDVMGNSAALVDKLRSFQNTL